MARFDYYRDQAGPGYLLDCQADLFAHFTTRVIAPLLPRDRVPPGIGRLHPVFLIDGKEHVLATHLLTAMPAHRLGRRVGSLAAQAHGIMNALDMLLTGI